MTHPEKKRIVIESDFYYGIPLDLLSIGGLKSRIAWIKKERQ